MKLSFVPLLLDGKSISRGARNALSENRREDAAALLMQQYDLDCREAGELLDVSVCEEGNGA
jgi:galactokinase